MGTSDRRWYKFMCSACGNSASTSVSDKGSTWGPPDWTTLHAPSLFTLVSAENGVGGPEVGSATCKTCGAPVTVESTYGFTRPEGY